MTIPIDSYLVTESGMTPLRRLQWLSERELDEAEDRFGPAAFDVRAAGDILGDWLAAAVAGREPPDALTGLVVRDDLIGAGDTDPESETPDEAGFDTAAVADHRRQAVARYQRWGADIRCDSQAYGTTTEVSSSGARRRGGGHPYFRCRRG